MHAILALSLVHRCRTMPVCTIWRVHTIQHVRKVHTTRGLAVLDTQACARTEVSQIDACLVQQCLHIHGIGGGSILVVALCV